MLKTDELEGSLGKGVGGRGEIESVMASLQMDMDTDGS